MEQSEIQGFRWICLPHFASLHAGYWIPAFSGMSGTPYLEAIVPAAPRVNSFCSP